MLGCFSSKPSKRSKEEVVYVRKIRDENLRLLEQNSRLLTINQELREQVKGLQEKISSGQEQVVGRLASMQEQADRQLAESRTIAQEAAQAREAAAAKEEQCAQLEAQLKASNARAAESAAKVQALEERAAKHAREKTKLMDQIQRRDHALFLARQVIDMVDRTGVLAASATEGVMEGVPPSRHTTTTTTTTTPKHASKAATTTAAPVSPLAAGKRAEGKDAPGAGGALLLGGAGGEFGTAPAEPGATIPSGLVTPRGVVLAGSGAAAALDELRRSMPTVRAALEAHTPPHTADLEATTAVTTAAAVVDGGRVRSAGLLLPEGVARKAQAYAAGASSGGSHSHSFSDAGSAGVTSGEDLMNPLWHPVSEPEEGADVVTAAAARGGGGDNNTSFSSPGANPAFTGVASPPLAVPSPSFGHSPAPAHRSSSARRATYTAATGAAATPPKRGTPLGPRLSAAAAAGNKTNSPASSPVLASKRHSTRPSSATGAAPGTLRDNDLRNSDQPGVSLFGSSPPSHTILLAGTGTGGGALRRVGSASKGQAQAAAAAASKSPLNNGGAAGGAGNARARYGATTTSPTASTAWA